MQTVLLTIKGSDCSIDLKLPAEVPVRELMPKILELCDPGPARDQRRRARWHLFHASTGMPLSAAQSLNEAGIIDGTILLLDDSDTTRWSQQQRARPFNPRAIQPGEQSGGIGVKWHVPSS